MRNYFFKIGGMSMADKKKDEIIIINKFKETSSVDIKNAIEKAFKKFYNVQMNKYKVQSVQKIKIKFNTKK